MKRIPKLFIASLTASVLFLARAEAATTHVVSFNAIEKESSADTADYRDVQEIVHIAKLPTLALSDFKNASVKTKNGRTLLQITLSDSGANKLGEYSASHVGEELAVLVDHRLLATPKIRLPLLGKAFQIDALDKDQARALARLINREKKG